MQIVQVHPDGNNIIWTTFGLYTRNFVQRLLVPAKNFIFRHVMAYALLILVSILGIAVSFLYLRKNIVRIKEKNKSEPKAYKRGLNYVLTGLWYGYLFVFFAGLTINNILF